MHIGNDADTRGTAEAVELRRIIAFVKAVHRAGANVHAGHGLTTANVAAIARIPQIVELNIGHSIVARSLFVGLPAAVAEMRRAINDGRRARRSEEHTSELQSLMRISYAVFCLTKKNKNTRHNTTQHTQIYTKSN